MLFVPMFIFALAEYKFIGKDYENYWCAKLAGTVTGLILIPVIYYTYTGIFGVNADWFNIAIFFIAAGVVYYLENLIMKNNIGLYKSSAVSFALLCVIAVLFAVMTFIQPEIPLFQDMTTGKYGI